MFGFVLGTACLIGLVWVVRRPAPPGIALRLGLAARS